MQKDFVLNHTYFKLLINITYLQENFTKQKTKSINRCRLIDLKHLSLMPIFGMSVNVPGDDKLKYINFGHTVAIEITC